MKLGIRTIGDIAEAMRTEEQAGRRAVSRGMKAAADGLKGDWRRQVEAGGLGSRVARTIRSEVYPRHPSSNAAAMVWTRAPKLIDAFERGALIRSQDGFFLAIPTAAAGARGLGRRRITPGGWEQRTGMRLRFVYRGSRPSLLVADDARMNTRGLATMNRRRARKDGTRTGSMTVPIFILLPQVRLRKRLDLAPAAERWAARVPGLIVQSWPRT
jgi:hypothetical protein